jgi:hypothetical protein
MSDGHSYGLKRIDISKENQCGGFNQFDEPGPREVHVLFLDLYLLWSDFTAPSSIVFPFIHKGTGY